MCSISNLGGGHFAGMPMVADRNFHWWLRKLEKCHVRSFVRRLHDKVLIYFKVNWSVSPVHRVKIVSTTQRLWREMLGLKIVIVWRKCCNTNLDGLVFHVAQKWCHHFHDELLCKALFSIKYMITIKVHRKSSIWFLYQIGQNSIAISSVISEIWLEFNLYFSEIFAYSLLSPK